jgi:arylsulfatase B
MATPDHTPRGRGYHQSLHYFHHANDYWNYQTGSCPSPANASVKVPVTDLWEGVLGGDEGPAHKRVPGSPQSCPYYQDVNRTDGHCVYEDAVFTSYVIGVIEKHAALSPAAPLFFCWTPHTIHAPLEVPASFLSAFDFTGGRQAGPPAWNRQEYMAMTHYMDSSIKNVTAALKSAQMWDETLVVFSADNVSGLCRVLACCQLHALTKRLLLWLYLLAAGRSHLLDSELRLCAAYNNCE